MKLLIDRLASGKWKKTQSHDQVLLACSNQYVSTTLSGRITKQSLSDTKYLTTTTLKLAQPRDNLMARATSGSHRTYQRPVIVVLPACLLALTLQKHARSFPPCQPVPQLPVRDYMLIHTETAALPVEFPNVSRNRAGEGNLIFTIRRPN